MRLLNAETLCLEEHYDAPQYMILSHRWTDDEVSYRDIIEDLEGSRQKLGFEKIKLCTEQTIKDGLKYCWIDTCCIDKSSSAALSEAINSMYSMYQNATVCYAYLNDVPSLLAEEQDKLFDSKWWTRGWTLQELLAPKELHFYSKVWDLLGTKHELCSLIHSRIGIPTEILLTGDTSTASVAQRMSWAAGRETTRIEDRAYCLMGIFDVNMPMIYGEGDKAFLRLQEEIIKSVDDHSIFTWTALETSPNAFRGLLARSPAEFKDCGHIESVETRRAEPYAMTNRGLRVTLPLVIRYHSINELIVALNCRWRGDSLPAVTGSGSVGIRVKNMGQGKETDQFARVDCSTILKLVGRNPYAPNMTTLHVRHRPYTPKKYWFMRLGGIVFTRLDRSSQYRVWPRDCVTSDDPLTIAFSQEILETPQLYSVRIEVLSASTIVDQSREKVIILVEGNTSDSIWKSDLGRYVTFSKEWRGRLILVDSKYDIETPIAAGDLIRDGEGDAIFSDMPTRTALVDDVLMVFVDHEALLEEAAGLRERVHGTSS